MAHQIPTVKKENLTASDVSVNPNVSGLNVIQTFPAKRRPPPRYPKEKPSAEIKSSLFSGATPGSKAS